MTMSVEDRKKLQEIAQNDDKFRWFVIEKFLVFESRISKVEVRAGVIGFLGGLIPGIAFYLRTK